MKRRLPRLCLAATVRRPGKDLRPFLDYHRSIGFERIYLFFDDPKDPGIRLARSTPGVHVVVSDQALRAHWKRLRTYHHLADLFENDIVARQQLNVELALSIAADEGMDWLFHIDGDELIAPQSNLKRILAQIPSTTEMLVLPNLEAVPQKNEYDDPFAEITLFKQNLSFVRLGVNERRLFNFIFISARRPYFLAYENGKAAVRVSRNVFPAGVHRFCRGGRSWNVNSFPKKSPLLRSRVAEKIAVHHYVSCGFRQHVAKFKALGNFPDRFLDRYACNEYRLKSRDALLSRNMRELRRIYESYVLLEDPQITRLLTGCGLLKKNQRIARQMKRLKAQRSRKSR